ncbi:MAG: class 1 fructose-bisphosphatase [Planctomycetes bacterium]|nr:class 1 fructose-bisphosphatase [Planctomycetota bacterium]
MVTLQQHIMEQQSYHPTATGEFSWLLSGLTQATKIIAAKIRRAGLADVLGSLGKENIQGEDVQKLDIFANDVLIKCLAYRGNIGILASEENEEPVVLQDNGGSGRYIVLFDPLDGSSNIDCNNSIGTIFSVLERPGSGFARPDPVSEVLQAGVRQRAAGYVIYGPSTVFVYTTGQGVHLFTLEPSTGAFVLHRERLQMPKSGDIYSVNESNFTTFPRAVQEYLRHIKTQTDPSYNSRYVGSFVADFHRTLLKGGIFLYPKTSKSKNGKLRLMYECNPMAFLAEQAGGMAVDGHRRILEIVPESLHMRTPLFIGSTAQVEEAMQFVAKYGDAESTA